MPSTHLYLIQSPLQAINAFEARSTIADGADEHVVVVFNQKGLQNNILIANTMRTLGWKVWRTVPFRASDGGKMLEWIRLRAATIHLHDVRRVYIGDFSAGMAVGFANLYPESEHYVLDDGTATHNFPHFRYAEPNSAHSPSVRDVPLLGYRTNLPKQLTFFSIYEVALRAPDSLRRNRLTFLRNKLRFDPEGPIFFIGACLPDVEVITFEQFFELFRAARQHFGNREIVYYPHRRELMNRKLEFLEDLGVRIAQPELPFELELIHGTVKPSMVATFYSTALDTLRLLLSGGVGQLLSYRVPLEWIRTESHREIARRSYEDYETSDEITVIGDYW